MTKPNIRQSNRPSGFGERRGWKCTSRFLGRVGYPMDRDLAGFLPVGRIARMPGGGLACVLLACRVESADTLGKQMQVGVAVMTPVWPPEIDAWIANELLPTVERCFEKVAEKGLAPVKRAEVELAGFYGRAVDQSAEDFAKNNGVLVQVRFDLLAGYHRDDDVAHAELQATSVVWRVLRSPFIALWDALFPPVAPPPRPDDTWSDKPEVVMGAFFGIGGQGVGRLLRRVTIYDERVRGFLARVEDVDAGQTASMAADLGFRTEVAEPQSAPSRSMVFELNDFLDDGPRAPATHVVNIKNLHRR